MWKSSVLIFDPKQAVYTEAATLLICLVGIAAVWFFSAYKLWRDYPYLGGSRICRCRTCDPVWWHRRMIDNAVPVLASLWILVIESCVGGFVRPASPIGLCLFVLIALAAWWGAGRALRRK